MQRILAKSNKMHLSIIIPAYNEARRIGETIKKTSDYLVKQEYDSEIIVVNDGSTDDTVQTVHSLNLPLVRVIDNQKNHGKGYVVKQGMLSAQGNYRVFMDADNSTQIQEIEKFWEFFEKDYSIVIGSRHAKEGGKRRVDQPFYRAFLARAGNYLTQILLLWGIEDTQCGFKAFTAKATQAIFPKQTIVGWGFDMEILFISKKQGFKIKEVGVNWYNEGESKFRALSGYISTLKELLKIRINGWQGKYK